MEESSDGCPQYLAYLTSTSPTTSARRSAKRSNFPSVGKGQTGDLSSLPTRKGTGQTPLLPLTRSE